MIRITTVIGARPQFIKASVMSAHFRQSGLIQEVLVHTGQHFDPAMSDVFFSELNIPVPQYNLGIHSATHGKMTGQMLIAIEEVVKRENPHYLMVYGDTNSTLAGALAAKKLHIPVIHIEAGLRSKNMRMPEEINRILTDRISDILCCPTEKAMANLKVEGFESFQCIFLKTGDIMEDALRAIERSFEPQSAAVAGLNLEAEKYLLCTVHRAENTDDAERLGEIMGALAELAQEVTIVVPLHPRTRKKAQTLPEHKNLRFIKPVGYRDNLDLIKHSLAVLTDSGGVQKEAYMMKRFCITLRDETEWTELTELSCNFLSGAQKESILAAYNKIKGLKWSAPENIYGGGNAREKIFDMILDDATRRGIL